MSTRTQALRYLSEIRDIQELKHRGDKHSISEWTLIIREQLDKAVRAWYEGHSNEALRKIGHVGACAVAAIEQNGIDNVHPAEISAELIGGVISEVGRAATKFPTWPTDPQHALNVLGEEFGELTKAVVQATYEPEKNERDAVRKEAIQTAAMAIRFLLSLDRYEYKPCPQHKQGI